MVDVLVAAGLALAVLAGGTVVAYGIVAVLTGGPLNPERSPRPGDTPDSGASTLDSPD